MSSFVTAVASGALVANELVDIAGANDSTGRLSVRAYNASTATSACPVGRATIAAASGDVTSIELFGEIVTATASGTVTAGDDVASTGTVGKVATATRGQQVEGRALETAATGVAVKIATVKGAAQNAAGDIIAEGVQHAHVADAADPGALTATSPGAGADGTTPSGAQWAAAVVDLAALRTAIIALNTGQKAIFDALEAFGENAAS